MRCRYCDEDYMKNSSISHYLFSGDDLCEKCRKSLIFKPRRIVYKGMRVLCFYEYNKSFKSMIIQYKECYDEALKDIFLYDIKSYLSLRYRGYKVVYVASSISNLQRRGFDHMRRILESLDLEIFDIVEKIDDRSQNLLSKKERMKMSDNFKIKEGSKIPDKILLVDDIFTTGSSLYGVYKLFKDKAKKIDTLAIAYVKNDIKSGV